MLKKLSLIAMALGYALAGINHFYNPASYLRIIPPYIPFPEAANLLAGVFELLFAIMLMFNNTRKLACWGIILILLAFLPVHISMVIDAPLYMGKLYVTPMIAWIRLIVLQPLLIWWAYSLKDFKK